MSKRIAKTVRLRDMTATVAVTESAELYIGSEFLGEHRDSNGCPYRVYTTFDTDAVVVKRHGRRPLVVKVADLVEAVLKAAETPK